MVLIADSAKVIDLKTGEVVSGCQECENTRTAYEELERKYKGALLEAGNLRKKLANQRFKEAEADQILEVLTYWRDRCCKRPDRIVLTEGGKRWEKVRHWLRAKPEPFSVEQLKAAVDGSLINSKQNGTEKFADGKQYLDIVTTLRDELKVEENIKLADSFVEYVGVWPSEILHKLIGLNMEYELEVCDCGHPRLFHVGVQIADSVKDICGRCDCGDFWDPVEFIDRTKNAPAAQDAPGPAKGG